MQINLAKSFALNVMLTAHKVKTCKASFPFAWQKQSITYIGIQLPTSLYTLNYLSLLRKFQSDLQTWHRWLFPWFGWAAIKKKKEHAPRLHYVLQTVPIELPKAFSTAYRRACTLFIWGHKHTRLSYTMLTLPKLKGGKGLPNKYKYYFGYPNNTHLQNITHTQW